MNLSRIFTCAALIVGMTASAVGIAAQRTFVSTSGDDTNGCSLAAPCRSFTTALASTDAAGEIVVLDSGGYGRVTIDKSVTITAPSGIYAGISVFPNTDGIEVDARGGKVVLRGLTINGQGGGTGIRYSDAAELYVEHCIVSNLMAIGLLFNATSGRLFVKDSLFRGNGTVGIYLLEGVSAYLDRVRIEGNGSSGLVVFANGGTASASVKDSFIVANGGNAVRPQSGSGGVSKVSIEGSTIAGNAQGGIQASSQLAPSRTEVALVRNQIADNGAHGALGQSTLDGATTIMAIDNTIVSNNGDGLKTSGTAATIVASGNTIAKNSGFGLHRSGGTLVTRGNNDVRGNVSGETSGVITAEPLI